MFMGLKRAVRAGAAAAAVVLAGATPTAWAQFVMRAGASEMSAPIGKRSLDAYEKMLGLSAEQKEAATALLEGYREVHKAAAEDMEAKMESLQEKAADGNWDVFRKEMPALGAAFREKTEAAEKSFFDDLKTTLSDQQAEKWDRVERHRRREQLLRMPFYSGASVDLVRVVEKAQADPGKAEFADLMLQYEMDVDRALVELKRISEEREKKMMDGAAEFDFGAISEGMKAVGEKARVVRDVNRDYVRKLTPLMKDEARVKFEEAVDLKSYPRVYRDPHVLKQIDAALGFSDITTDQKQELNEMKAQFRREAVSLNTEWARSIDEAEEEAGGGMLVMMQGFQGGGGEKAKASKEAREARRDLEKKTKSKLEGVLSKEQQERLPKKKASDNPWADFMPEPDEEEGEGGHDVEVIIGGG